MKRRNLVALAGMLVMLGSVLPVSAAESLETFDYETYADTYPDLKAAFGYDAAALYNHYISYGKAEGRVATFTEEAQVVQPTQAAAATTITTETLDPLPPLNPSKMPDWFDARTPVESMTNARLVAEYNALVPYMEAYDLSYEAPLCRKEELLSEMNIRLTRYDYYEEYKDAFGEAAAAGIKKDAAYQRAAASDITPLREFMG